MIPFPELKTLKIVSFPLPYLRLDETAGSISKYVMERIEHGYALDTVDFTEEPLDILPEMEFLGKADGLKVLWRQCGFAGVREYICGTDEAHAL